MNRKEFIHKSIILGSAFVLPHNNAVAHTLLNNGIDKLTDESGNFVLGSLPYAQNALEPFMDEETVHLHYTFHHGGAVKGANNDQQMIKDAIAKNDYELADYWVKKSAHHFSSHVLHSIYWTNLINKKSEPKGELLKRIERNFTSFDQFKGLIASVSKSVLGNGWGILAYQPFADSLVVLQCENHEKLTQFGCIPLLVIDVWEHSYYLKYRNRREQFVDALFNIINWDNVALRLDNALRLK